MSTLDQSQAEQPSLKELTPEDSKALQNYLRRLASKSEALDGEASIVVKKINRTLEKYGHSLVTLGDHPEWLLGKGDTDEMEQRLAEYVAAYKQTLAKTKPLMNENAYLRAENQKLKDKLSFRKKITDEFSRKASTVTSGLRSIFKRNENSYEEKITYGDVRGLTEPLRNSGWFLGPWMVFPDYICNRLLLPDHEKESFEMMVWETIAQSITSAIIGGVTIGVLNGADKLATWQFQVKPAYEEAIKSCEGKIGQTCITGFRGFPYYMPWLPFSDERTLERELTTVITGRVDLPQTRETRITYTFNVKEFELEGSPGNITPQIESGARIHYVPMTPAEAAPSNP